MKHAVGIIVALLFSYSHIAWSITVSPNTRGCGSGNCVILYTTLTPSGSTVPSSNLSSGLFNRWVLCPLLTDASGRLPPGVSTQTCTVTGIFAEYIPGANISRPNATTTVAAILQLTGAGPVPLYYQSAFSDFAAGYNRVCLFVPRDNALVPTGECATAAHIPLPTNCTLTAPARLDFGVLPSGTSDSVNATVSVRCDTDSRVTLLARSVNGSGNVVDLGSGVTASLYIDGVAGQVGATKAVVMNAPADFNLGVTLDIPTTATGSLAGIAVLTAQWP